MAPDFLQDGTAHTLLMAWFGATPIDVLGADGVTIPLVLIAVAVCFWIVEMRFPVANASAGDHLSAALA
jgi:hypothetical protein